MPRLARLLFCFAFLFPLASSAARAAEPGMLRFDRDIRPILSDNCFHCHGPDTERREGDLRLDIEEEAKAAVIVPGAPGESELLARITSDDPDMLMPPAESNKKLTPAQIELIKQWIEQGANWTQHWSFIPPKKSPLPKVKNKDWPKNGIDHFILSRLEREGLSPSKEANRRMLIRRLSFDLTGLPPTLAEIAAFEKDQSPNAYEKLVDRLLNSRRYGERMAVMWLDAARYGDTSVFHADGPRDMWAWRDRVVEAYNENLAFDQFSTEQLAGDLLPNPTIKQQMSAAFNRNNGTTDEGGAIAEEYRVEYVVDRVKTTSKVWLGLSMECGQCHDHKYDPISNEEYYQFYAFFNISADAGMQTRSGNATPIIKVPDPEKEKQLPGVRATLAELGKKMKSHREAAKPAAAKWLAAIEKKDKAATLLPSDAVVHFALEEGKGKAIADSLDPNRKGTIQGSPQWISARFAGGLKLDGSTYADLGDVGNFERTDQFSYGCWLKPEANAAGALMARMNDANSFRGYDLLISGDGKISVHIIHKWAENAIKVTTKKGLKPNQWQHVFATYDGSSKAQGVKIYVDGEVWDWNIEQDRLSETIRTNKTLYVGSRNPGSRLRGEVDEIRVYSRALKDIEIKAIAEKHPLTPILALAADKRTEAQKKQLLDYYLQFEDADYQALAKQQTASLAKQTELLKPLTTLMVMNDMAKPRDTFMLARGAYNSPTDRKVFPGTPNILPPMGKNAPANRLGLARWLFQDDHPLTSRVTVNRYWQMLFGIGLVSTPADFGSQGDFPSHPQLIDWLAVDFRENGWNVKRTIKQILMSATYQQSSQAPRELYQRDPQNRLLARGPRFRLQSEFLRDNALAVSGLLIDTMGGPGVKPYQPAGLWVEVGLSGKPEFKQDHGEKLYRRSLYTYWKRSSPPPSMQIFDAPTREGCAMKRPRTNTPLQALVMLNDIQFVEAARNLAQRIIKEGGEKQADRAAYLFELTTSRKAKDTELKIVLEIFQHSLKLYRSDTESATKLINTGESPRDEKLDIAEHAAWTVVANMILNLDETLTRE